MQLLPFDDFLRPNEIKFMTYIKATFEFEALVTDQ